MSYGGSTMQEALRTLGALTALSLAALVGCGSPQGSVTTRTDGAIIGGADVTNAQPFANTVVSLVNTAQGSICTASILSSSILVTAAHCVDGDASDLVVVINRSIDETTLVTRQVTHFKTSPVWAARQSEPLNNGDIAVVRFEGGLAPGFAPVKMLTDVSILADGGSVTLAGYGNDDGAAGTGAGKLRWVETTLKKVAYTKSELLVEQSKGKGACHGDSGGPAYTKVNGDYILIGVTSRGVDDLKNDCSVSAAYTSVPYYSAWSVRTAKALNTAAKKKPTPATPVAPAARAVAAAS
ncbi:MAG: trypsin-like serine protease [Bdellovibrionota bacterium]